MLVDYEAMGRRIKMKRRERRMSQQEHAKAVQISALYFGNLERGSRVPSIDTLVAIANTLDVGLDFLLADSLTNASSKLSANEIKVLSRYLRDRMAELDYADAEPEEFVSEKYRDEIEY